VSFPNRTVWRFASTRRTIASSPARTSSRRRRSRSTISYPIVGTGSRWMWSRAGGNGNWTVAYSGWFMRGRSRTGPLGGQLDHPTDDQSVLGRPAVRLVIVRQGERTSKWFPTLARLECERVGTGALGRPRSPAVGSVSRCRSLTTGTACSSRMPRPECGTDCGGGLESREVPNVRVLNPAHWCPLACQSEIPSLFRKRLSLLADRREGTETLGIRDAMNNCWAGRRAPRVDGLLPTAGVTVPFPVTTLQT